MLGVFRLALLEIIASLVGRKEVVNQRSASQLGSECLPEVIPTVALNSIPWEIPEGHLESFPGQPEIYHGGFSISSKYRLVRRGSKPEVVVVKRPKLSSGESDVAKIHKHFKKEAKIMSQLHHRNILPLRGITYQFGSIPCLVTPLMSEGTLTRYIDRNHAFISMERRFAILHEVASGLQHIHRSGIVHGDLTGFNILMDHGGTIYISDFGLSYACLDENESIPSNICTPRWAATELFVHPDQERIPIPTASSDVYSFGCIVLQVLSGRIPFWHISRQAQVIILKYQGKDPLDEWPADLSVTHWEFLQSTWSKPAEIRPSSDQVLAFMEKELERCTRLELC